MDFHVSRGKIHVFVEQNQGIMRWGFGPPLCGGYRTQVEGEQFAKLVLGYYYHSCSFMAIRFGYPRHGWVHQYPDYRGTYSSHCMAGAASENQEVKTLEYLLNRYKRKEDGKLSRKTRNEKNIRERNKDAVLSSGAVKTGERLLVQQVKLNLKKRAAQG